MRRSIHSLIVALLCLTLFVDSAKACWWLRQHRGRSQVCQPAACRSASPPGWVIVRDEPVTHEMTHELADEMLAVDNQGDCVCCEDSAEHAHVEHAFVDHGTVDHAGVEQVIEHHVDGESVMDQGMGGQSEVASSEVTQADRADSVVVHGPTIVVDAAPAQPAPGGAEPASVMAAANAAQQSPAAAQPMPVASANPAALPTPAQEPIPNLKPAITPQSPVAPASNEQLMLEPAAAPHKPIEAEKAVAPVTPMPAAVEDLAGGPEMKPPRPEPKEPNLFDLYGDEGDEDAPATEASADSQPEMADDDAGEPAEESAVEATATDELEMADEDAEASEEATDGESETAEEADAAPQAEPEQAEADPAAAAWTVPNEPMRNWSDDTGTHRAQGWLVEVGTDSVRILKVNGRHTTVWTESLSAADRDYVSAVGDRLAAKQQGTSPAPSTTAGL